VRPVSPFNHEGREAAAITHWSLRRRRHRIEPAALVSGTAQNKSARMPAGKSWKEIKKILLSGRAASPEYRNDLHLT
jgi:hypothetical protein